jgi:hypothetical protein
MCAESGSGGEVRCAHDAFVRNMLRSRDTPHGDL